GLPVALPGRRSREVAVVTESVYNQMKIDESGVRMPPLEHPADAVVSGFAIHPEPSKKFVAPAHVVAREDVDPPETAEHHVLRGPASHAANPRKARDGVVVPERFYRGEIRVLGIDRHPREPDQIFPLLSAQPECAQGVRIRA